MVDFIRIRPTGLLAGIPLVAGWLIGGSAAQHGKTAAAPPAPAPYQVLDAYDVYNAVLPDAFPRRVEQAPVLRIQSDTAPFPASHYSGLCLMPDAESEPILGPAIGDYRRLNHSTWRLEPYYFKLPEPFQLVSATDALAGFQAHPEAGQWVILSAVGFNPAHDVAVVYLGHSCGADCGGGEFYTLRKTLGKWRPLAWTGSDCQWSG